MSLKNRIEHIEKRLEDVCNQSFLRIAENSHRISEIENSLGLKHKNTSQVILKSFSLFNNKHIN